MVSLDTATAAKAALFLESARYRATRDFLYFLEEVLGIGCHYLSEPAVRRYLSTYADVVNHWLEHRHDKAPDGTLVQKTPRKVLVVVPRKTFKSSAISQGSIPYALCNDPNLVTGVMCASYEDLAISISKSIRDHLEGNSAKSRIKALFGDFKRADAWGADKFTIAQRNNALRDPSVQAYGVRKGAVGHHFDYFVIDDPVTNEAMQNNSDWLDRTWRAWVDLKATLNPNALVTVVMTRYHDADLAGRIIDREILPAAKAANDNQQPADWNPDNPACIRKYAPLAGWTVIYEQAVTGLDTDSPVYNFPGIWGPERIAEVRAGRRVEGDEETEEYSELFFWCQLQNTPQKREDNPIQPHHIEIARGTPELHKVEDAPRLGFVDIHCDFAFKSAEAYLKQRGDWSVMQVTVPHNGFVWRLNGWRGKVTQDMFGEELIKLATWARNDPRVRARVRFITYDRLPGSGSGDNSTEKWITQLFYQHGNLNIPTCLPISRTKAKTEYILGTAWAWQEGWVRLCDMPFVDPLVYQMQRIGYSPNDDDADSFANAFHPDVYKTTARVTGPDEDLWDWTPAVTVNGGQDDDDFDRAGGLWV